MASSQTIPELSPLPTCELPSLNDLSLSESFSLPPATTTGQIRNHQFPESSSHISYGPQQTIIHSNPPSSEPRDVVVRMENVHKTYLLGTDGVSALRGVSLQVYKGEFVAIYGNSGCGKSTMLSVLGTIDRHTKGDLYLFGNRIISNTKDSFLADMRLFRIGFVFQSFNLLPTLNALENVELPMILAGNLSKSQIRQRALYLLEKVGVQHRAKSFPAQLSGGEQQRVTIARALSNHPDILLMDEPTGDLDTKNTDFIMNFLIDLHEREKFTIIMVTHDVGLRNYADKIVQMRDGKITRITNVSPDVRERMKSTLKSSVFEYKRELVGSAVDASGAVKKLATSQLKITSFRTPQSYQAFAAEVEKEKREQANKDDLPANLTMTLFRSGLSDQILPDPSGLSVRFQDSDEVRVQPDQQQ